MEPNIDVAKSGLPLREGSGWLLGLGIALVLLGAVALAAAFAATLATVLLFGALLLVAGLAQLAQVFTARSEDAGWETFTGLVYTAAGVLIVIDPVGGAVGLTLLLAVFFLLAGAARISLGLRARSRGAGGGGYLLLGVVDLLLGLVIAFGWPGTAVWVIGLLLGIELLLAGAALIAAGTAQRRLATG